MITGPPFYDENEWEPDPPTAKPMMMQMFDDRTGAATHYYADLHGNLYSHEGGDWEKVDSEMTVMRYEDLWASILRRE